MRGSALAIHRHPWNFFGVTRGKPRQPGDVAGLASDGIHAAGDDVVDGTGIQVVAVEQSAPGGRPQVDRMHSGQRSPALAHRGANGIDDVRLTHD